MEPENIIKGRIAEAIIEELLRTSGNKVYRFGYESILQNLIQTDSGFDRHSRNGEQVRSIPDFVVVNPNGRSFFVEVKFRSDPVWLIKAPLLKQLKEYWQAKLILVTITKPYFRIVDPQFLFEQDYSFEALQSDPDFYVTAEALRRFEPLVKRFLINGKRSHEEPRDYSSTPTTIVTS
ncbi:MAG: hypothetical protein GEU77_19420 [Deltaproteobacteria bacterium]|nr:hypothetical protein [Deltaproteobacteria bacterium]